MTAQWKRANLRDEVGLPVLVGTDQEGGIVRRVSTDTAAAAAARRVAAAVSREDWRTTHALPFETGIGAGAPIVMFGYFAFIAAGLAI